MRSGEHKRFVDILAGVLDVYGKERSDTAIALWWKLLEPFDMAAVEAGLAEHARTCRFAPTPADVIAIIQQRDGRPTADEAWSMIPRGESESVAWTDEMASAYGIAQPLLEHGDQIAARRAFIDRYTSAVQDARAAKRPVNVWFSWGWDARGRAAAVTQAVSCGLLTQEGAAKYAHLLPYEEMALPELVGVADRLRLQ